MTGLLIKLTALLCAAAAAVSNCTVPAGELIRDRGSMDITVIDYGVTEMSAEAILVSSGDDRLLMDTAYTDTPEDLSQSSVIRWLKEQGIRRLDLYLSHWHNDHYFLLTTIMEDPFFEVRTLYLPESSEEISYSAPSYAGETWYNNLTYNISAPKLSWGPHSYQEIMETASRRNIEIVWLDEGSVFRIGNARAEVLWHRQGNYPSGETVVPYLNDRSLVTMISCGGVRYLTCGDLHKRNEQAIIAAGLDVRADIFKASHHADATSNCEEWIAAVSPSLILSTRQTGDIPGEYVEDRLKESAEYLSVREIGTFTIHIDNGTVTASGKGFELQIPVSGH